MVKTMNPVRVLGIANGWAEKAWRHQTWIKGTARRSGHDRTRNQRFKQSKAARGLGPLPDCNVSYRQHKHQTSYFKWPMDHFNGYVRNKTKMSQPSFSPMMLIFVIYGNLDDKEKEEWGK